MTDRQSGFIVVLEKDMREDDAKSIIDAISMIKGVLEVTPLTADPMSQINQSIVRNKILMEMIEIARKQS